MPDWRAAARLNQRLINLGGNLSSDGRPILGLDARDLLEITLESDPQAIYIPAHIWTPWFSLFGSKSGFDAMEECFADLTGHITALETGLSSDPAMNWRLSALDGYALVRPLRCPQPGQAGPRGGHPHLRAHLSRPWPRPWPDLPARPWPAPWSSSPRGQIPFGRAPQMRGAPGTGSNPRVGRPLPGMRRAAHRGGAQPGGGLGRPTPGAAPARSQGF